MDVQILEELGMSKGEIKVYLTLLEIGNTKIGVIIKKSNMASSAVFNSINSLIDKGLVSYIKRGKIKYYESVPPKQLLNFIDEKRNKVAEIISELEFKRNNSQDKQDAEVFEGIKGVTAMLRILIENTKKGDEYLFFASNAYVEERNKEIQNFFEKYDIQRKEKKLVMKGFAPKELKKLFIKRKMLHMKYPDFPILSDISICNNKVAFLSWDEKPVGFLITSKRISDTYRTFFKKTWNVT